MPFSWTPTIPAARTELDVLRDRVARTTALAVVGLGTPVAATLQLLGVDPLAGVLSGGAVLMMVLSLVLFHAGRGQIARLLVIACLSLALISHSALSSGITSVPFAGWTIAIVLATVVLGSRAGWLMAALGISVGGALLALEQDGLLVTTTSELGRPQAFVTSCGLFLIAALLTSSLMTSVEQALTRRARAVAERTRLLERYSHAAQGALFGIWEWDLATDIIWTGPGTQGLLGRPRVEISLTEEAWIKLVHPRDRDKATDFLRALQRPPLLDGSADFRIHHADKDWLWVRCQAAVVLGSDGRPDRIVGSIRDISEHKSLESTLEHRVNHDFLTGLPNRKYFLDRLEAELPERPGEEARPLAVLFVDLDGFKLINDSLGHAAGDELLIELAQRLRSTIRDPDLIARLGGDEFVLLLYDVDQVDQARAVVDRIEKALAVPFQLAGRPVYLRTSVGILLTTSEYTCAEDILRDADLAMYSVKGKPSQGVGVFEEGMRERILETLELDQHLASALDERQIVPWFQPIVDLRSGDLLGLEALARWIRPYGEILTPTQFIHRAEATGLITRLDRAVLAQAAHTVGSWNQEGAALHLSVNLSARHFSDPDLVDWIGDMLDLAGLAAGQLQLEITEAALLSKEVTVTETLAGLKDLGVRIALDDFGTGYSSLSYLHAFEIQVLKIDIAFVQERGMLGPGPICKAIQGVAESLDITTVAEGVETEAQREALVALGCWQGQGFLYGAAASSDEVWPMVEEGMKRKRVSGT